MSETGRAAGQRGRNAAEGDWPRPERGLLIYLGCSTYGIRIYLRGTYGAWTACDCSTAMLEFVRAQAERY
jgi:hypothetical protein